MILVDFFCKSHYTYISVNVKDTEPDVTGNVFELRFLQKKQFVGHLLTPTSFNKKKEK